MVFGFRGLGFRIMLRVLGLGLGSMNHNLSSLKWEDVMDHIGYYDRGS